MHEISVALKDIENSGFVFADSLTTLDKVENKSKDESTMATAVDVDAQTAVAQNDETLMAKSTPTLIEADVQKSKVATTDTSSNNHPTPVPNPAQTAQTAQSTVNSSTIKNNSAKIPLIVILIAIIGSGIFLLLPKDPILEAEEHIDRALSKNQSEVALSIVEKILDDHPGEERAHDQLHLIIDHECEEYIEAERFDEGIKNIEHHRQRFDWLHIDKWRQDILLAKAKHLRKHSHDHFPSEAIYRELRKEYPTEMRICEAYVADFNPTVHDRYSGGVVSAAYKLIESGKTMTEAYALCLIEGFYYARHDSERAAEFQTMLLHHYQDPFLQQCREKLSGNSDTERFHAYNALHAAEKISPLEQVHHHLRNVFLMTSYSTEMQASLKWLNNTATTNDNWAELKQQIDFSIFASAKIMESWSDRQKQASAFIATQLFDEMQKHILNWLHNDDEERLRFNAFVLIRDAKRLDLINIHDFHHTTLKTFHVGYGAPSDFDEAILYFTAQLKTDPEGTRTILLACKKRVQDYIALCKKEKRENDAKWSPANITAIDEVLK
ncbi:MAG: hypothetical protein HRU15_15930 [Planctomycetes bacterium]|nr:hypothetical protein [Planctomycetota bacterium]